MKISKDVQNAADEAGKTMSKVAKTEIDRTLAMLMTSSMTIDDVRGAEKRIDDAITEMALGDLRRLQPSGDLLQHYVISRHLSLQASAAFMSAILEGFAAKALMPSLARLKRETGKEG